MVYNCRGYAQRWLPRVCPIRQRSRPVLIQGRSAALSGESGKPDSVGPAAARVRVIGWAIGLALDRWLNQHWMNVAGLILGAIAGFVQTIRIVLSHSKE